MSKRIGKDAVEDFIYMCEQNLWFDDMKESGIHATKKEWEDYCKNFLEDFE